MLSMSVRVDGDDDCLPQDIVSGRGRVEVARCLQVTATTDVKSTAYGLRWQHWARKTLLGRLFISPLLVSPAMLSTQGHLTYPYPRP